MSKPTHTTGAGWVLAAVGALAAAAMVAPRRRGSGARTEIDSGPLTFSASADITIKCDQSFSDERDDLEYDWEPGDDLPDEDDLRERAEDYFNGMDYGGLGFECHPEVEVSDVEVDPHWSVEPTIRPGRVRIVSNR